MRGRNVERLEVMEIVFDLRAIGDFETETQEQGLEPLQRARNRMPAAEAP